MKSDDSLIIDVQHSRRSKKENRMLDAMAGPQSGKK